MAFAAVVLVEQIIQQFLHSDNLYEYDDCLKSEVKAFHHKIESLQSSLGKIYPINSRIRKKVHELESDTRKVVYAAQDRIEEFISSQIYRSAFLQKLKETTGELETILSGEISSARDSIKQILEQVLLCDDLFPCDDCPRSEIESFHADIRYLQSSIRSEENGNELRSKISKVLDLIKAFISSQTAQSAFLQNLKEIRGKLDPIVATAKEIADSMEKKQQTSAQSSANAETSKYSRASKVVGQEKDFKKLKDVILQDTPDRLIIPITGLPGIGKTTLARCIFEDKEVGDGFAIRSWVTVGQEYNAGEIFSKLLASVHKRDGSDSTKTNHWNAEQLAVQLHKSLFNNRYLIVVDDVWDIVVWDRIKKYLPDNNKSSRVVVTTRIDNIAVKVESNFDCHKMKELDKNESWELLREKVFGDAHCPPDLMIIGKSIANNCRGLPLSITVVGGQLSQEIKNTEYWKTVEEDIRAAIDLSGEDYLRAILSRSYEHLPCRLKGCFLYMGAFPEDSEVTVSKLVKLWVAEGFLEQTELLLSLEDNAEQCLTDLLDRNLIFPLKFSSNGKVKTCGMHDSIRSLAEIKSEEESFFVSVKKFPSQRNRSSGLIADSLKGKDTQRRISVHKNILMCMEDVYKSAKSVKPARTLLYAGHYHHHPLPFCLSYHWLRVLDALTVHLTKFPKGLVKLIHLRYLSLTYNGKLPASLSQLKNILVLIVRRHPKVVIMGKPVLPVEIWYMKQLRHILLTECDFPDLSGIQVGNTPLLENLQSLSSINVACCTEGFFKNMPNLKKLGIWIEAPGPINFDPDLLPELEAFKLTVLKPIPGKEIKLQKSLVSPMKLKKLSLSGCGLAWECMADIGKFPCLQVLKLRQFAFQGPEWTPVKEQFPMLKLLLIECLDLEYLKLGRFCCESLESIIIKNCYELQEIDQELIRIGTLKHVELVGCNYDVVHCAEEMRDELSDAGKEWQLRIYSSWGEESSPDGMQLS
ncbi:putative late blight resistance protein homolog R1B-14 [Salvia splendens]|uniref:putative late blight resistance protein homolog R1B-14 n=1 Tax=Salvia splendens TaxID=180675 RepID=UPI001C26966B|nr:putative late blight resistance protein homolog R1B-14 [Salvia splendens]